MRPIVGVLPLWDDEKQSIWMLPGYLEGIRTGGGIPLILPLTADEKELKELDGLLGGYLFTGGQDVDPALYSEKPHKGLGETCKMRDEMEKRLLELALSQDKPVLGICRGIQLINACLGGSLYQDLPSQFPSGLCHHQEPPYDEPSHEVLLERDSPLFALLNRERLSVNSYHHQAVKEPAPGLSVMARAGDGLIEALCKRDAAFVWAVQWHPEFSYPREESSRQIFSAFVSAIKGA